MDFSLLFDKIDFSSDWKQSLALDCTYHSVYVYDDVFPDLENVDIVLLSIDDNRGTDNYVLDAIEIRKHFYKLKKGRAHYNIADIGTLRPGTSYQETLLRLKEVLGILLKQDILPVIINASQDVTTTCYHSLINADYQKINIALIDNKLDNLSKNNLDQTFVWNIIEHETNRLRRLKLIGYQSYLVDPNIDSVFRNLAFQKTRLGSIKKDVQIAEPNLRNSQLVSFDLEALKSIDFPANGLETPFGLTAEEACQLTWYAGISSELKCFIFSGYKQEFDKSNISAHGLSVMVWHLIEGYYSRLNENLKIDSTTFIVENESLSENITFLKGNLSNKWWILIDDELIPCRYEDYQQTNDGILPEVWLRDKLK